MRTYSSAILFLIATTVWAPKASAADEVRAEVNGRFKQATNRTFKAFDQQREQTWQQQFPDGLSPRGFWGSERSEEGFARTMGLVRLALN